MPDNKTKNKADRKRVALSQEHEREYLLGEFDSIGRDLEKAGEHMVAVCTRILRMRDRLRAGFPRAASKRGKP